LSGGEEKDKFWRVVAQCTAALPADKPRYLMGASEREGDRVAQPRHTGVGYAVDMVVASCLGVDMFDCVFPTRYLFLSSPPCARVADGDWSARRGLALRWSTRVRCT
jgi:hypothetical protein